MSMDSLQKLSIENDPMHPSAIYCLAHLKSAKAYKPSREPRKKQFKYADVFYNEILRSEILKEQNGLCLLDDDNCSEQLHLHHIDFNKYNNHKDNLVFLCHEHHFGVHKNKYTLNV